MIKESLFATEERETKLNKLGDVLQILEKHVDFAALAAVIDVGAVNNHQLTAGRLKIGGLKPPTERKTAESRWFAPPA